MTSEDFAKILIESIKHKSKNSFFELKRSFYHCLAEEFIDGLKEAFEDLEQLVNTNKIQDYFQGERGSVFLTLGKVFIKNYDHTIDFEFNVDEKTVYCFFESDDLPYLKDNLENYFQYLIKREAAANETTNLKTQRNILPDHAELLSELKQYVFGIGPLEFSNIINHNSISPGEPKARWKGSRAEARYFADFFHLSISTFNKCFVLDDGVDLRYNDQPTTKKHFKNLLKEAILK